MKTKFLIFGLLLVLFSGCARPDYLPKPEEIGLNQHGSFIKITHKSATQVSGELIAIDSAGIIVLAKGSKRCLRIPVTEIKKFKLQYAQQPHYGWSIPVFSAVSLVHGLLAAITLPTNLIVTTLVTISGENDFKYNNRNISYHKLKMFARFPQGVPAHIDLATIQ